MNATSFGHYQLQQLIGQGGMGEVYQAYDTKTDRVVAIKVLPHHMAVDETFQARFRRESQAAAGINDPHVVPIHGYGEIDGRLYLDMRLIEGRNLGTMLADTEKPLGAAFAVTIVEQVGHALDAAHQAGLIHRDIKPSNILITGRDFVYLIDFGLARTAGEKGLTTAGSTLGTLAYMAPERFEGGEVDARSDIYALTCVLYECLTGSRPYPADSLEQQIAGHMVSPLPRPSGVDPRLAAFDEVIAKGMAKKPAKRYQSAGELAAAARRALNAPVRRPAVGPGMRPGPNARRRRRLCAAAGAAVLVVALAAIGLWQWAPWRDGGDGDPAALPEGAIASIAATVPADIRETGRLVIGVNVPYAPMEFKNADGQLVGFDVELMNAVAKVLGLVPDYRDTTFDAHHAVGAGRDCQRRDVLGDRHQGARGVGRLRHLLPGGHPMGEALGYRGEPEVAVRVESRCGTGDIAGDRGTTPQERRVRGGRSGAVGHRGVVQSGRGDERADQGRGRRDVGRFAGDGFRDQAQPRRSRACRRRVRLRTVRLARDQGSGLAESLRLALEHLMETGEYRAVATMWGVERGMIDKPVINGAIR